MSSAARLAVVTGATGAIGGAIARGLARLPSFEVVLIARDEGRGRRAAEAIRRETGNERVRAEGADLASLDSIGELARRLGGPVHVLVNDAAVAPPRRQLTAEGRELVFAVNVLAYERLTRALEPNLRAAAPARVVNVASYWAGDLDLDDPEFERRRYDNGIAYRQSKQANRMLTVAAAARYRPEEITVNVCHSGDVNSRLSNDLGFGGSESPEEGAATPVWLATASEVAGVTGKYFAHRRQEPCPFARDRAAIARLVAITEV